MDAPDVQKHAALLIGNLSLELATARAVIEQLQTQVKELSKPKEPESEITGAAPV